MSDFFSSFDSQKVMSWLTDSMPTQGAFLPVKLTMAGWSNVVDKTEKKTLAETVSAYKEGVVDSFVDIRESALSDPIPASVYDFAGNVGNSISEGVGNVGDAISKALTLPDWMKYTIIAAVLLGAYELTKKA